MDILWSVVVGLPVTLALLCILAAFVSIGIRWPVWAMGLVMALLLLAASFMVGTVLRSAA